METSEPMERSHQQQGGEAFRWFEAGRRGGGAVRPETGLSFAAGRWERWIGV